MISPNQMASAASKIQDIEVHDSSLMEFQECMTEFRRRLSNKIEEMAKAGKYRREDYDEITKAVIVEYVDGVKPRVSGYVSPSGKPDLNRLKERILNKCLGYDILDPEMHSNDVNEIQILDFNTIRVEINGVNKLLTDPQTGKPKSFESWEDYLTFVQQLLMEDGRKLDNQTQLIDSTTKDGYRVNVVGYLANVPDKHGEFRHRPMSVTIRRQKETKFTGEMLIKNGTFSNEMYNMMEVSTKMKSSTFIVGATGSGKTVIMQTMIDIVSPDMRISAVGSPPELSIRRRDPKTGTVLNNVVHMESREWTGVNKAPKEFNTVLGIMNANLRLTPDLMVFEEIRRSEEFANVAAAGNTGHTFWTTYHAASASQAANRFVVEYQAANGVPKDVAIETIAGFVRLIIVAEKQPDRTRKVIEIAEVDGWKITNGISSLNVNTIFKFIREDSEDEEPEEGETLSLEYLNRKVNGSHYRVGSISETMQELMVKAGFPKYVVRKFSKPLEKNDRGEIIPEKCTYEYAPIFGN